VPPVPPEGCAQPTLTVLFHYAGPSGDASAVKYVAPSGARVFASGSLQFAWGLDTFATEEQGHTAPVDPRLQQLMRNAIADMSRPAPPASLTPTIAGRTVQLGMPPEPDPRIREIDVYQHDGAGAFAPAEGVHECHAAPSAPCSEPEPPGHRTYRYAAVAIDEWGQSAPVYSAPFVVPDTPPAVRLTGPRRARRGTRVAFAARAPDRDGDRLTYRWRLDGRVLRARASRVSVRIRRRGLHRLAVAVSDGFGGVTRASAAIAVR
jgi:PKD domain